MLLKYFLQIHAKGNIYKGIRNPPNEIFFFLNQIFFLLHPPPCKIFLKFSRILLFPIYNVNVGEYSHISFFFFISFPSRLSYDSQIQVPHRFQFFSVITVCRSAAASCHRHKMALDFIIAILIAATSHIQCCDEYVPFTSCCCPPKIMCQDNFKVLSKKLR